MKIRRYVGSNTQEAILKVKMDLGSDALILNTKKVRQKGLFKFFAKPMVEVLAAVDENKKEPVIKGPSREETLQQRRAGTPAQANSLENGIQKDEKLLHLETKVNQMEGLLKKIYDKMSSHPRNTGLNTEEDAKESEGFLQIFYNNLVKNDVEPEIAKLIIEKASERTAENSNINDSAAAVYNAVVSILGKPQSIKLREDGKPTIVIFSGPTGVGKTTTLAKIAANYTLIHKKAVGLITADTYRISAVDQLKTYAEIIGIPLTVLYSVDEVSQAVESYRDKELILIDTAGRSYKDKVQYEELNKLISLTDTNEIYLVISATTSSKVVGEILANYSFLQSYKLILTKIDESTSLGLIANARHLSGKCLSYITTGQSVPDDIELADIDKITKNLIGSIANERPGRQA